MKVEILSQWDLRRKAAKGFDPRTALISLGDWGSEPFTLPRQPGHTLRLLCNDITPALVNLSDPKDMFRLFSREQAGQVARFVYNHLDCLFLCQCCYGSSRSAAVAAALLEHFEKRGMAIFRDDRYYPNLYIFRLTLQALEQEERIRAMIKSPTAWMLRQDGEAFPVIQHLYGSLECVEETLYAGEWLYKHTSIPTTQQLVLKLVAAYGKSLYPHGDVVDNLRQSIQEKPYIFLTLDFVEKIAAQLPMADPSSLEKLNCQVTEKLNQEFLRCRLGGLYNTVPGCRDMYFRVSNPAFDWEPAILRFLETHGEEIETVTVVWDEESTGRSGFALDEQGKPVDHRLWKEIVLSH